MKTGLLLVAAVVLAGAAGLALRPQPAPVAAYPKVQKDEAPQLPPGHPAVSGIGAAGISSAHHPASAAAEVPVVAVQRATGKNAKTIAELHTERANLAGQRVRVRGQVVKVTQAVLGKNYLRLRDGSSEEPSQRELVVTTQIEAKRGDVILLEGTLRTDVDVGIGLVYPALLEDAVVAQP